MKLLTNQGQPGSLEDLPPIPTSFIYGHTAEATKKETKQIQFKHLSASPQYVLSRIARKPGFNVSLFLAHLRQRLIGELKVYPWSGVRPSSSFTISNIFSSETALPSKAKCYVEPNWVGGTKRHPGHMTKMAATSIYGKNPLKIFSGTGRPISMKLGM